MSGFRGLTAFGVLTWLAALALWFRQPPVETDFALHFIALVVGAVTALISALWVARGYPSRAEPRRWANRDNLAYGAAAVGVICLYLTIKSREQVDAVPLAFGLGWLAVAVWRAITLRAPVEEEPVETPVGPSGDSASQPPPFLSLMLRALALVIAGVALYLNARIEIGGILFLIAGAFVASLLWELAGKRSV